MTSVFRITVLIACSICAFSSSLFGVQLRSYTFRSPTLRDLTKWHSGETPKMKKYGRMSGPVQIKTISVTINRKDLIESFRRVVGSSDFFSSSNSNVVQDSDYCLLSTRQPLFGWSNTIFQKAFVSHGEYDGEKVHNSSVVTFEYRTVDVLKNEQQPCAIRIRYSLEYKDGKVSITRFCARKGIASQNHLDGMLDVMDQLVVTQLQREVDLVAVRSQQQTEFREKAALETRKRKMKELDKVIHPEKYRNKSPSVRRTGSSGAGGSAGGGGRYTPSADTQARRQVKRGG